MVSMSVFTNGMNKLSKRWSAINTQGLEDRYFKAIEALPEEAFKEIIYNLLDSAQKMPLPKDFNEAAKDWRNRFYKENGFYFGSEKNEIEQIEPGCKWCLDTGVLKVMSHNDNDWKFFSCDCDNGKKNEHLFPIWSNELLQAYKKVILDFKFKPEIDNLTKESQDLSVYNKIFEWKKLKLNQAEKWKELGYEKSN